MKRRATRILFLLIVFAALTTIVPAPPKRTPLGPGETVLIDARSKPARVIRRSWADAS